jgi:hypothetical protein
MILVDYSRINSIHCFTVDISIQAKVNHIHECDVCMLREQAEFVCFLNTLDAKQHGRVFITLKQSVSYTF